MKDWQAHNRFINTYGDAPESSNINPEIRGQVDLWRAIIAQAICDASGPASTTETEAGARQEECYGWFEEFCDGFIITCFNAHLNPLTIHRAVMRMLESGRKLEKKEVEKIINPKDGE